jgi:transcriptional regulator with XRE-family HTH domain
MPRRGEVTLPNLVAWRIERGYTQTELAEHAKVTRATVSRAESGEAVTVHTLHALAKALGLTVQQLMNSSPADQAPPGKLQGAA